MESATHAAAIIVGVEILYRTVYCSNSLKSLFYPSPSDDSETNPGFSLLATPGLIFIISYIGCVSAIYADVKNIKFFKSTGIRNTLSFLHAIDGINALAMGFGLYFGSSILFTIGLICMIKGGLLYLLSRMVTGQAAHNKYEMLIQTTKTYLHHVGSFIFLTNPTVTIITAIWRFVSMNGHAILTVRDKLAPKDYERYMWMLTHARNVIVVLVLILIIVNSSIRRGFAISASGHIAYLLVRAGPVFRLGSLYLDDEFKKKWQEEYTDYQRVKYLLLGKNFYFALEIGTMLITIIVLLLLRLRMLGDEIINDVCHFF